MSRKIQIALFKSLMFFMALLSCWALFHGLSTSHRPEWTVVHDFITIMTCCLSIGVFTTFALKVK